MTEPAARKLEVLRGSDDDPDSPSQTFVLRGEDHTLGNVLRYMIMKNPEVDFCGYNVPHPLENKIHLRIQTNGVPAIVVLQKGLKDTYKLCEHMLSTFEHAVENYEPDEK